MSVPSPEPDQKPPARPSWVKVSLIIAAVVLVLAVLAVAFSGGEHGPGRHLPGGRGGDMVPVQHDP